jgi:hypothetical protein
MIAALILAGDFNDRVLRVGKIEIQKDPPGLAHQLVAINAEEKTFGKDARIRPEVVLGDQLVGIRVLKYAEFQATASRGPLGRQRLKSEVSHWLNLK